LGEAQQMQSTPVSPPSTVEHREPTSTMPNALTMANVVQRCRAVLTDLDCAAGGCVLCQCSDFLKVSASRFLEAPNIEEHGEILCTLLED
jgi:hypothetical protein